MDRSQSGVFADGLEIRPTGVLARTLIELALRQITKATTPVRERERDNVAAVRVSRCGRRRRARWVPEMVARGPNHSGPTSPPTHLIVIFILPHPDLGWPRQLVKG